VQTWNNNSHFVHRCICVKSGLLNLRYNIWENELSFMQQEGGIL